MIGDREVWSPASSAGVDAAAGEAGAGQLAQVVGGREGGHVGAPVTTPSVRSARAIEAARCSA